MNKPYVLCALAVTLWALPSQADRRFQSVDYPGATGTLILGVNDRLQYVGIFVEGGASHAMFFDGRQLTALDASGLLGSATRSRAYALNNLGEIVGSYNDAAGGLHGYVYQHGVTTTIDYPGGAPTEAYGVNDLGQVIGVYYDVDFNSHGFALCGGVFTPTDLPGSFSTVPLAVNDRGETVGEVIDVPGTIGHGFRTSRNGSIQRYDAPGAAPDSTFFISINNLDQILGASFDAAGNESLFVITRGVLAPFDFPASFGATFVSPQTIDDLGVIGGYYADEDGTSHGFLAVPHGR